MMMLLIHLLAVVGHTLPFVFAILDIDGSLSVKDMSLGHERRSVLGLLKIPGRRIHEHHIPAFVRNRAMASGTR